MVVSYDLGVELGDVGTPIPEKISSWEWLLGGLGGLVLLPYLWWKGRQLKEQTGKAIQTAGYIGIFIIILFLVILFTKR